MKEDKGRKEKKKEREIKSQGHHWSVNSFRSRNFKVNWIYRTCNKDNSSNQMKCNVHDSITCCVCLHYCFIDTQCMCFWNMIVRLHATNLFEITWTDHCWKLKLTAAIVAFLVGCVALYVYVAVDKHEDMGLPPLWSIIIIVIISWIINVDWS